MDMSFLRYVTRQGCKRSSKHINKRFGYDCLTLTYTEYRRAYGNSLIYACGDHVSRSSFMARMQRSAKQESHGFNRAECQRRARLLQSQSKTSHCQYSCMSFFWGRTEPLLLFLLESSAIILLSPGSLFSSYILIIAQVSVKIKKNADKIQTNLPGKFLFQTVRSLLLRGLCTPK